MKAEEIETEAAEAKVGGASAAMLKAEAAGAAELKAGAAGSAKLKAEAAEAAGALDATIMAEGLTKAFLRTGGQEFSVAPFFPMMGGQK